MKKITPLLFTSILLLLPLHESAGAQLPVLLDSLIGKAEVQRAGTMTWVAIERDEKLYNNDILRIAKGGFGRVRWPDNSEAFIHGGTQMLINIGPLNQEKQILSYATVFMGSVFFVIKKIFPSSDFQDIQVYTPTAVISIRGTAFLVDVKEKGHSSSIKVISGTVKIRCIAKNASAFLRAPFKTVVTKLTAPIVSKAILAADIDSLKTWVPAVTINQEIERQLSKSKRDQLVLSGAINERCQIVPFSNTSTYTGDWDITHVIPRLLAERMRLATNRLVVTVIETDSGSDTTETVQKRPERFRIDGSIAFIDIVNHAEITVQADEYRERAIARVTLNLELHDANNKEETFDITITGERSGKKNNENSWKTIAQYPFDIENEQFAASIMGNALEQALDVAAEKLILKIYE